MRFCVMDVDSKCWLARPEGVLQFVSMDEAKNAGVMAGRSFVVVEVSNPQKRLLYGLMTSVGFIILDDTLQGGNTSSGPGAAGSSPVGADQNSVRPLV